MAQVAVTLKILPENPNIKLEEIGEATRQILNKHGKIANIRIQPIAYGINAIVFTFIMDESKGGTEKIEEEIRKIKGISDVSVDDVTRLTEEF
ncbi:MAG: elongation factor 1-beta [Candidatus Parvarchaeota archaeon]|nr:elongation factor 1-beta [Candidatus Jingweiarchaeum tengchongense]MCW1297831.1 elongation factor 1-beta [Candidatus Jingweiarchaeum tengchongense]MCW1299842.1 elongation factor 1-beta [Candidatus Jingweiarchaeum tengchongense]MCW1304188.1 elongation factor 1-beta [Candidatus Jingweiarchaeum tengchongense]MCW1305216.1 elongation factor 1-beta [Candidatus Jingweiarchaeum tengchongense]